MKRKPKKEKLMVRSVLVTEEIDAALTTEATTRGWGKSKLMRRILIDWVNYWRESQRKIKIPKVDSE